MNLPSLQNAKFTNSTRTFPPETAAGIRPFERPPAIGDLVVAEVLRIGHHKQVESPVGSSTAIYPGDVIVGAFGNRYATDQFEGYVPRTAGTECDLMSVGGLCGEVRSRLGTMGEPTRLRILGAACDAQGRRLNLADRALPATVPIGQPEIVLLVGSSMNSGKTTTLGTLARSLSRAGLRVAAAKVTGTAAGKDLRFFSSNGARPVLDFIDAGFPSTYLLGWPELWRVYQTLIGHLQATRPDYILVEIADGLFQRETRMFLENDAFRASVSHVFFSANDSLSAECGVRRLRSLGLPLRAVSGQASKSPLLLKETEEATGMPCLSLAQMMEGAALDCLRHHGPGTRDQTAADRRTVEELPLAA